MGRRSLVGLLAAGLFLLLAAPAFASCPNGYMTTGPAPHGDGGPEAAPSAPSSYLPGDTVEVHGSRFEVPAGTEVTLRWGVDGDVIGRAVVSAEETWSLTFELPTELAFGTYMLVGEAYLPDGTMAPGLPSRLYLTVGDGVPAGQSAVPPPVVPEESTPAGPVRAAATQPVDATRPAQVPARPAAARPAPAAEPAPTPVSAAAPAPAAPTTAAAPEVAPPAAAPRPAAVPLTPAREPEAQGSPVRSGAVASGREQPPAPTVATEPPVAGSVWLAVLLAVLGVAVAVAAAGAIVLRRRAIACDRRLEAELQEIIAEERARRRDDVGTRA